MFSIKSLVGLFIISSIFSGGVDGGVSIANAAVTGIPAIIELDGYMWSSTIGWISLNCKTGGTTGNDICGTGAGQSDYRVVISTSGNLSGFAWSSNIGWIRFGGLSQYPIDIGNPEVSPGVNQARVEGAYSPLNLTFAGWARACAGTLSPVDRCDNMGSRTDGWDGWISLKGNNYQLRFNSGGGMYATSTPGGTPRDGFFWGSTNVGWVAAQPSMKWSEISATLTGADCEIESGESSCSTTLTWSFLPINITDPTVNKTSPIPVVTGINTGGSASDNRTYNLVFGANTFQARTGTSLLKTLTINASCKEDDDRVNITTGICEFDPTLTPDVVLTVENSRFIRSGDKPTLSWTVSGVLDMSVCKLTGPQAPNSLTEKNDTWTPAVGLTSYSSYTLSCATAAGTDSSTVNVEVIPTVLEN